MTETTAHYIGTKAGMEFWGVGRIAFVIPAINDQMPDVLKDALAVRRSAMLTGHCQCGAEMLLAIDSRTGEPTAVQMEHESACVASDRHVRELVDASGWRLDS